MYTDTCHNPYAIAAGPKNINIHNDKRDTWQQLRKFYKWMQVEFHNTRFMLNTHIKLYYNKLVLNTLFFINVQDGCSPHGNPAFNSKTFLFRNICAISHRYCSNPPLASDPWVAGKQVLDQMTHNPHIPSLLFSKVSHGTKTIRQYTSSWRWNSHAPY